MSIATLKRFKWIAEQEDFIQAGYLGLVKAAHKYDASKGSFSNCAIPIIRQAMQLESEVSGRTVIIPLLVLHRLYKIQSIQNKLRNRLHREPTIKEVSDTLGLKEDQIEEAIMFQNNHISLNTPDGERDNDKIDSIADPDSLVNPEEETNDVLRDALRNLKPFERKIVVEAIIEKRTLREIGRDVKLSAVRVGQIKIKALNTMRKSLGVCNG